MLDKLKKYFKTAETQVDAQHEEEPVMDETQKAELATLVAGLEAAQTQLKEALEANASMAADLAKAQADLAAASEAQAALAKQAADKRLAERTKAVEAAVGTEKAVAVLAATESLDDTQFNAIVSAMATSIDAEGKSAAFKEAGVTADVDASKVEPDLAKRLADKIAAENKLTQ